MEINVNTREGKKNALLLGVAVFLFLVAGYFLLIRGGSPQATLDPEAQKAYQDLQKELQTGGE